MGTLTVNGLGKAYKQYPTRWSRLAEWLFPFGGDRHQLKWVIRDVSFEIAPGEYDFRNYDDFVLRAATAGMS